MQTSLFWAMTREATETKTAGRNRNRHDVREEGRAGSSARFERGKEKSAGGEPQYAGDRTRSEDLSVPRDTPWWILTHDAAVIRDEDIDVILLYRV